MSDSVLDRLEALLRAASAHNTNLQVAPVALLWPDEARHWTSIIGRVGERLPVVTLGSHDPAAGIGPAYWIRCVVAGTIDLIFPDGIPIVYLPGVARASLRAVDSCPPPLAPIAELQYRSEWFSHPNGRDWTIRTLLSHSDRGLGLNLAPDAETAGAALIALERLVDEPMDRLARQFLDADFFHDLVNPDPVRSVLDWLDDPVGFRARSDEGKWAAFSQQCKADYGFDPNTDGEITAARLLGGRMGAWSQVWSRFAESPERYPGVPVQLEKARPEEQLALGGQAHSEVWPQDNAVAEDQLRKQLLDFEALTAEGARNEVLRLEAEHAWRRATVWALLDQAPLAFALEQLASLASVTTKPLVAGGVSTITDDYVGRGWRADDAVLRALEAARRPGDQAAVEAAARAMYLPWLDDAAKKMQAAIGPLANAGTYQAGPAVTPTPGIVTLFVDGLRLDVAHRIQERLGAVGLNIEASTGLAALPTVTNTAKPALTPVGEGALVAGPGLQPANSVTGTKASIQVLRALMSEQGVQVLRASEIGDPAGSAWAEAGEIDHKAHDSQIRFVDYLDEEVARVVLRIRELLEAGWQRVEVVTDHGWILMPGAMEKVELPPATVAVKKGRCARLKEGAVVESPTVPWYWDPDVRIALAPGVTCFEANQSYDHGGVSPQECVVPRLSVTAGIAGRTTGGPEIVKVRWLGLQCRIEFTGVPAPATVDIRGLPAEPKSSIAEHPKETSSSGRVSLLVPDEDHQGERAHLVIVSADGSILAQREVVVGSNR